MDINPSVLPNLYENVMVVGYPLVSIAVIVVVVVCYCCCVYMCLILCVYIMLCLPFIVVIEYLLFCVVVYHAIGWGQHLCDKGRGLPHHYSQVFTKCYLHRRP